MPKTTDIVGHPVHQMLIPIPLGLFVVAAAMDIVYAFTQRSTLAVVSFWNIVVGIVAALVAAVFGALDWWRIPPGTRAKRIGILHGLGNVVLVLLFLIAAVSRFYTYTHAPSTGIVVLEFIALLLAVVTGWLGGELVDRLGVGVAEGANVNALSSLSSVRARARR